MLLSNWAWKMEPGSPDLLPFDSEEVWLFEDDTAEQAFKDETPSFKDEPPSPSSRAQVATKLLQDLDDLIKKVFQTAKRKQIIFKLVLVQRQKDGEVFA
uniref:Uncharacterized protein n=1 Tax=Timema poppense TaxID=170557 RepID=A0A7R9DDI9_TIMPO|nr:unnamed protein product [Timema poppensis]